jgi:hypothetical protein
MVVVYTASLWGLDLGPETGYPRFFVVFAQSLQANAEIVP